MSREQTGISGEFWFFNQLYFLGYQAYITLGNTKSVDLAVTLFNDTTLTFDVKSKINFGGSFQYLNVRPSDNHYYVFLDLAVTENDGKRTLNQPSCFIVHSKDVEHIAFHWQSSTGSASGYGFEVKLLKFLKYKEDVVTENIKNKFMQKHNLSEIDFDFYNKIIWSLTDFEDNFYTLK